MKKEQREVYRQLAGIADYLICSFCRYGSYSGSACGYGEYECEHSLSDYPGHPMYNGELYPYADCWAFRNSKRFTPDVAADVVGVILANGFKSTQWSTREDGIIEVVGVSGGEF